MNYQPPGALGIEGLWALRSECQLEGILKIQAHVSFQGEEMNVGHLAHPRLRIGVPDEVMASCQGTDRWIRP